MSTQPTGRVHHYREALRLTAMCVDDNGNPPAAPAPELDAYLRLAQIHATLATVYGRVARDADTTRSTT